MSEGVLEIVQLNCLVGKLRPITIFIPDFNLGIKSLFSLTLKSWGILKLCLFFFEWNLGKAEIFLKNLW